MSRPKGRWWWWQRHASLSRGMAPPSNSSQQMPENGLMTILSFFRSMAGPTSPMASAGLPLWRARKRLTLKVFVLNPLRHGCLIGSSRNAFHLALTASPKTRWTLTSQSGWSIQKFCAVVAHIATSTPSAAGVATAVGLLRHDMKTH